MSHRQARRTPRLLAATAVALMLTHAGSIAAARDYDPTSRDWAGSSYLLDTAAEARVELQVATELDWSTVSPDRILLLISPEQPVDDASAAAFLEDGGHIVVADDFGGTDRLLDRVGIHKVPGVPRHDAFLQDHPAFPLFSPTGDHFLFFNIASAGSRIAANHPTAFELDDGATAILRYGGGAAFIAEAPLGRGALLAVADGSIFINEMLHQHGDKQLAANLLRYYCTGARCEVTLVAPWAPVEGRYESRAASDRSTLGGLFRESVAVIDAFVGRVSRAAGEGPPLHALALAALGALGLLLGGVLLRRRRAAPPVRPTGGAQAGHPATHGLGLSLAAARADFRGPGLAVATTLERSLRAARLVPPSIGPDDPQRYARAVAERLLPRDPDGREALRRKVLNVLTLSARLRAASGAAPPPLSASEFEALDDDARHILRAAAGLGAGPDARHEPPVAGSPGAGGRSATADERGDPQGLRR